ncbi:MAG: NAD-binding protein [Thermoplasmata archaeon]
MRDLRKLIPYLVLILGAYYIIYNVSFIIFNIKYLAFLPQLYFLNSRYSGSTDILYGVFLLLLYSGLKRRTWTSWYAVQGFLLFYIMNELARVSHILIFDILGISISLFTFYLLWKYRKEYVYPPTYMLSTENLLALSSLVLSMIYGIGGSLYLGQQFSPPITNLTTAFYYTIEVMTTLGFGDILPVTNAARLFTSSLVVFGIVSFLGSVVSVMGPVLQKRLEKVVNIMENVEFSGLKNHIIFCGYNPIINSLVEELRNRGIPLVLIVRDTEMATYLKNDGYIVLHERADNTHVLELAGIKRARQVILSSADDNYNLMVALIVSKLKRELNLKFKISLIVNSSKNIEIINDFIDETINLSSIVKDYLMKNFENF